MRRLHTVLLSLTILLCLMRFAWLRADFPNHSPWMLDQAKFTDEGWWANGAVRHVLTGHWQISEDYNPAIVVPVWPVLLTGIFQLTGVSLVAARALSVLFSLASVTLIYLLTRRYSDGATASVAALLLAASPFAFTFSRLATLDTIIVFEFCLMLWIASSARSTKLWPPIALGFLIPVTLFTKTTALVLMPAVFWLLWMSLRSRLPRALLVAGSMTLAVMGLYLRMVLHSRYAGDYRHFFKINAMADIDPSLTGSYLQQLLHHGMWVDRLLYPTALAILVLSLTWLRSLWKNPLFAASWIALAGQAVFILRRQDDYAPRYFLPMLVPVILVVVLPMQAFKLRRFACILPSLLGLACVLDTAQLIRFMHGRTYQFWNAAQSVKAVIRQERGAPPLMLGTSADQLSLMTGIPAINDGYGSPDLEKRLAIVHPGWYIGWNDLDQDILAQLSAYRLEKVATYNVFDHKERDLLTLYRMQPARSKP